MASQFEDEMEDDGRWDDDKVPIGCIAGTFGCYHIGQQNIKLMSRQEIEQAIQANLDDMTPSEQKAVHDFAEDRTAMESPFSTDYEHALENDHNFRTIFSLSLMQTTCWTDEYTWDLFYFILQKHPVLGYFAHHAHPLEIADRSLVIVAGVCICLINQVTPLCKEVVCDNTCFQDFVGNGLCEDGGNFTWAGTSAEPRIFPCDYGTDCDDCGNRDEHAWMNTQVSGHADGAGIWCFSQTEIYVKVFIIAFIVIPLVMFVITQLILCSCCITQQNNKKKIFWTDFGQNLGNSLTLGLCATCGYFVHGDKINIVELLLTQAGIYTTIIMINFITFSMRYKKEKILIAEHGGMKNFILASMSLDGMFDDHELEH